MSELALALACVLVWGCGGPASGPSSTSLPRGLGPETVLVENPSVLGIDFAGPDGFGRVRVVARSAAGSVETNFGDSGWTPAEPTNYPEGEAVMHPRARALVYRRRGGDRIEVSRSLSRGWTAPVSFFATTNTYGPFVLHDDGRATFFADAAQGGQGTDAIEVGDDGEVKRFPVSRGHPPGSDPAPGIVNRKVAFVEGGLVLVALHAWSACRFCSSLYAHTAAFSPDGRLWGPSVLLQSNIPLPGWTVSSPIGNQQFASGPRLFGAHGRALLLTNEWSAVWDGEWKAIPSLPGSFRAVNAGPPGTAEIWTEQVEPEISITSTTVVSLDLSTFRASPSLAYRLPSYQPTIYLSGAVRTSGGETLFLRSEKTSIIHSPFRISLIAFSESAGWRDLGEIVKETRPTLPLSTEVGVAGEILSDGRGGALVLYLNYGNGRLLARHYRP